MGIVVQLAWGFVKMELKLDTVGLFKDEDMTEDITNQQLHHTKESGN